MTVLVGSGVFMQNIAELFFDFYNNGGFNLKFKFKFLIFFIFLSYLFNSHVTYAADVNYFNECEMNKKVETNVFLGIVNQNLNIGNQNNNDDDQDNNGDDPNENSEALDNAYRVQDETQVMLGGGNFDDVVNRYYEDYE